MLTRRGTLASARRQTAPRPRTRSRLKVRSSMAWTNFVLTVAGVAAVASLMRTDVRTSTRMLRHNLKQIRVWMEEGAADIKSE